MRLTETETKNDSNLNDDFLKGIEMELNGMFIKNKSVMISIPCNYDFMYTKFVESLLMLNKTTRTRYAMGNQSRIDTCRNMLVENALKNNFEYILFLDSDMYPQENTLMRLLNCQKDIVGCLCFAKLPPFKPCFGMVEEGKAKAVLNFPKKMFEVDMVGMGCTLIKTEVFRKMDKPYFQFGEFGEDFTFCLKAKEKGFKIFLDASNTCYHLTMRGVGNEEYYRYMETDGFKLFQNKLKEINGIYNGVLL